MQETCPKDVPCLDTIGRAEMHLNAEHQPTAQLDGQTSINDYLAANTAIIPVDLREPTNAELVAFLQAESR